MSQKCYVYDLLDILKKEDVDTGLEHQSKFDKDFYIDCLLNGNPIGTIVLFAKYPDVKSYVRSYGIIDGKKRIQAIKEAIQENKKLLKCFITLEFMYNADKIELYRKTLNNL